VTADPIADFYRRAVANGHFEGQLDALFQAQLERANADLAKERCDFYHTMTWADGEVTPGVWDLRGRERSYLGWVDVAGRRVIEFGPATGHLTFHMEAQGANLVTLDLAPGMPTDIIPQVGHDLEAHRRLNLEYMERVRNSWWYGHQRLGSHAQVVYGDICRLPSDIGRFDVATFGSILMHLSRPFAALAQAAAITDKAIVVTEPIPYVPEDPYRAEVEFAPIDTAKTVVVWWQHWPGAIVRMLRVLGFLEFSVYFHLQRHHVHHEMERPAEESLFFTVVAERHPGWAPRLTRTETEIAAEREIVRTRSRDDSKSRSIEAPGPGLVGALLRRAGLRS
jgi:hypothetical protein